MAFNLQIAGICGMQANTNISASGGLQLPFQRKAGAFDAITLLLQGYFQGFIHFQGKGGDCTQIHTKNNGNNKFILPMELPGHVVGLVIQVSCCFQYFFPSGISDIFSAI